MAFSKELAKRIRHRLARRKDVEEQELFGGVGSCSMVTCSWVSGRTPSACGSVLTREKRHSNLRQCDEQVGERVAGRAE
jgi:hypothetical protein